MICVCVERANSFMQLGIIATKESDGRIKLHTGGYMENITTGYKKFGNMIEVVTPHA